MARETKSPTGCRPGQLFGLWCILPERLERYVQIVQGLDFVALAKAHAEAETSTDWGDDALPRMEVPNPGDPVQGTALGGTPQTSQKPYFMTRDGIAVIRIAGPTTKYTTSFSEAIGGTSTKVTQRLIRLAAMDSDVRGIMLHFDDAPGGTVAGAWDLADDIRALSKVKPFRAHADDTCCSAGMLFAAATGGRITANQTAEVGSIGVRADAVDMSEKFAKEGVTVHHIVSGKYKAAGAPDSKITPEYIADVQDKVNKIDAMFVKYVAEGRPNLSAKDIRGFEARVFLAADAKANGLIDDVCSFEESVGAFADDLNKQPTTGNRGPAGPGMTAANGTTDMDLPKLLAAAGLPATTTEADALAHVAKMNTDLSAATAKLAAPPADILGERMSATVDRLNGCVEKGTITAPAAAIIKTAIGAPADDKGDGKPVAALLTPLAALGNKTVASWTVDLFKASAETETPEDGEKTGHQGELPQGSRVLKRNVPGKVIKSGEEPEWSAEREAELLGKSSLGNEVLDARKN